MLLIIKNIKRKCMIIPKNSECHKVSVKDCSIGLLCGKNLSIVRKIYDMKNPKIDPFVRVFHKVVVSVFKGKVLPN